jgi:hypothetical protein
VGAGRLVASIGLRDWHQSALANLRSRDRDSCPGRSPVSRSSTARVFASAFVV